MAQLSKCLGRQLTILVDIDGYGPEDTKFLLSTSRLVATCFCSNIAVATSSGGEKFYVLA